MQNSRHFERIICDDCPHFVIHIRENVRHSGGNSHDRVFIFRLRRHRCDGNFVHTFSIARNRK